MACKAFFYCEPYVSICNCFLGFPCDYVFSFFGSCQRGLRGEPEGIGWVEGVRPAYRAAHLVATRNTFATRSFQRLFRGALGGGSAPFPDLVATSLSFATRWADTPREKKSKQRQRDPYPWAVIPPLTVQSFYGIIILLKQLKRGIFYGKTTENGYRLFSR